MPKAEKKEKQPRFLTSEKIRFVDAKSGDLKPKKRTEFPRKVSDKTLGAYVRQHPHRTLRKISQAVGLAVSNVHRHLKNGGDFKKTTLYAERCPQKRAHFQEELAQLNPDTVALWMKPGLIIGFFAFTLERPEVRKLRQIYRGKTRTSQYDWRLYAKKRFIAPFTFKGGGGVTQMFLTPGLFRSFPEEELPLDSSRTRI